MICLTRWGDLQWPFSARAVPSRSRLGMHRNAASWVIRATALQGRCERCWESTAASRVCGSGKAEWPLSDSLSASQRPSNRRHHCITRTVVWGTALRATASSSHDAVSTLRPPYLDHSWGVRGEHLGMQLKLYTQQLQLFSLWLDLPLLPPQGREGLCYSHGYSPLLGGWSMEAWVHGSGTGWTPWDR